MIRWFKRRWESYRQWRIQVFFNKLRRSLRRFNKVMVEQHRPRHYRRRVMAQLLHDIKVIADKI